MTTVRSTVVPTRAGDLNALVHVPDGGGVRSGVVLVDGSGDGTRDGWGGWPELLADAGAIVLAHDKPGCGGSPGDWRQQGFDDRADESVAALGVLRSEFPVARVGLLGVSQGGWVSLLAATRRSARLDFVVSVSGPGVSVAEQDRARIVTRLAQQPLSGDERAAALDWVDERAALLLAGEPPDAVLARQSALSHQPWFDATSDHVADAATMAFLARVLAYDPRLVLPRVPCRVLALFGAADPLVPIDTSVQSFLANLAPLPKEPHGLAVFPSADHGLFVGAGESRRLAAGVAELVGEFVTRPPV